MSDDERLSADPDADSTSAATDEACEGRRDALTKLAYVSPVIAGLLFSQRSVAQFSGGPPTLTF